MKVLVEQSNKALPASAALEVAVLVTLEPDASVPVVQSGPRLHVGFCLDRSGSMGDASGVGGLNKMDALKAATQGALQLLAGCGGGTRVTLGAFSDATQMLATRQAVDAAVLPSLLHQVEGLGPESSTCAHPCVEQVLAALTPHDCLARRLVLVTDGQFNSESIKPVRKALRQAGDEGVVAWVFATGVTYAEEYLRELASLGAPGSLFMHVTDLAALQGTLKTELDATLRASAAGVDVRMVAGAGVHLVDALRLMPVQSNVPCVGGRVTDHADVLDARGQAYVVRTRLASPPVGTLALLGLDVRWTQGGQLHTHHQSISLEVLPAGSAVPSPATRVVQTVLSAQAAQQTMLGNAAMATQLYAAAGQTQLAAGLGALGTALQGSSDAARALRTQVLGNTRLVALGTAAPAKGGTP